MKKLLCIVSLFYQFNASAQESVFFTNEHNKTFELDKFGVSVYNANFIKNDEYFNNIADGLTILGTHLHPEFIYNSANKTQFKAGVFLIKNFGENNINFAIPTFSFNYIKNNSQLTIGNLFAKNNHNLIEPLMASEKILSNEVIETGIEYKYDSNKLNFDAWLNWENYIRKYSEVREVFTMGMTSKLSVLKHLSIPIQYVYYHRGGQINKKYRSENNLDNTMNFHNLAMGLEYATHPNLNKGFTFGYNYLYHITNTEIEYPFKTGRAHYATLTYKINHLQFLLAYYNADKFTTAKGNEMFQSYSLKSNINYWNGELDNRYVGLEEPNRSLLFTKVFYQNDIANNIKLGFQVEGYYQLNNNGTVNYLLSNKKNQFDYSYGVFLILNDILKL